MSYDKDTMPIPDFDFKVPKFDSNEKICATYHDLARQEVNLRVKAHKRNQHARKYPYIFKQNGRYN